MKRLLTAVTAAALSFSMVFTSLAAVKLETPTVRWSSEEEAMPEWTRVENAGGKYQVEGYVDGNTRMYNVNHHTSITSSVEWLDAIGFASKIEKSGIYKFRVMALGDGTNTLDSDWSDYSPDWTFKMPSVKFGTPTNLHWEGTSACWSAPTDSATQNNSDELLGYEVNLYADGKLSVTFHAIPHTSHDFVTPNENFMDEDAKYTFSVRAISKTPSKIFHGNLAYSDGTYDTGNENVQINNTLDSLLGSEDLSNAPDALNAQDIKKVAVAMDSDEAILNKVKELEDAYMDANGITTDVQTSEESGVDANEVHVIGMGLNAAEGASKVTFNVSKPDKEKIVDEKAYKNCIQFSFGLDGAIDTLKVPVQIEIPVPAGINPDHFVILHYNHDNTISEILIPKLNEDKTKAIFTVTGFSVFVFAEEGMDILNVATPSNAKDVKAMADALPADPAEIEENDVDAVVSGLLKINEAAAKLKSVFTTKDEALLKKLDSLYQWAAEQGRLSLNTDEAPDGIVEQVSGIYLASGKLNTESAVVVETTEIASPSNASKKLEFTLSMFAVDENGEKKEIKELNAPMWLYISIPEEYGYEYKSTDSITVAGGKATLSYENGLLVIFTDKLGKFTITKKSTSSGGSGSGRTKSVKAIVPKSPAGGQWVSQNGGYYYKYADGMLALNCWLEINSRWYHFGVGGKMDIGWLKDNDNNYYYLNPAEGAENGAMLTGWQFIDGKWYYLNPLSDGFKGTMLSNTTTPDGYTLGSDGAWIQ